MIARSGKWRLISVLVATFATAGFLGSTANAQDYTTGTVAGVIQDIAGNTVANATVTLVSDKGVRRVTTADADGEFRMPQLPLGEYRATVVANGFETLADAEVYNRLGATGRFTFTLLPESGEIEEIVTVGVQQASVDFESNTSGISVNVEELTTKFPVVRSVTDVALFAPGTLQGEQDFNTRSNGNLASVSGGSVAENAYYVNGLNITNFRNFTGGSEIPFEFFDQIEVKTGGYQAEFGRSMGGFVNAATKSGSNDFHFEVTGYWTPEGGRETRKDVDRTWNSLDYDKDTQLILQASGPIIQDRLFFYGLYNDRNQYEQDFTVSRRIDTFDDDPFYAAKIDFVPFDGHRLEYTYFTDERTIRQTTFGFNAAGLERDQVNGSEVGAAIGDGFILAGGENHIWRYTAFINDNFSVSATYGENEFARTTQSTADANPVVFERISATSSTTIGDWVNTFVDSGSDSREAFRFDADVYFEAAGDHHIRFGFDQEDLTSEALSSLSGGEYWRFNVCRDANGCFNGSVALGEEWVRHLIIDSGGSFETKQEAIYVQDSWQVSDRLTVNIGLRSETFENLNSLGETFIETDDEIAPRLGFTYDLRGDGRTQVEGFFGRYYMPIATNTNIRLSGAELFIEEFLTHNGFDQRTPGTDAPTGVDFANPIQFNLVSDGEIPPVEIVKAEQLDPLFSDEYIVGIEHVFDNEWVAGARFVYRELSTQIDDIGINHAIVAWALENGYDVNDVYEWIDPSQHGIEYVLANPGENITVSTDTLSPLDGSDGLVVMNLTKEQLEYPTPKREYTAIELTASKETDQWGIEANYVYAQNEGNTEGVVKSDNGQDDAGLTQDFDLVALGLNADGPLPTEIEHQLKLAGYYIINDSFRVGATARIRSPRKFGCFGVLPDGTYGNAADAFDGSGAFTGDLQALRQVYESQYDDDYWFCGGEATPRGSQLESDWVYDVDVSATFQPQIQDMPGQLTFRIDVFNLFNDDSVTDRFEQGEAVGGVAQDNYGTPSGFNTPRSVRLSANWRF